MPSTYTDILRLELQADGENDGTWGQILNDNVIALIEDAIAGTADVSTTGGTTALTTNDGAEDQARKRAINVTGSLASDAIIEVPAQTKPYRVINGTSGSFTVEVLVSGQSAGNGVVVPQGFRQEVWCDGTNVEPTSLPLDDSGNLPADRISGDAIDGGTISNFASTGIDDNASSTAVTIDSSGNVGIGTSSPGGDLHVASNSPVFIIEDSSTANTGYNQARLANTDGNTRLQTYDSAGAFVANDYLLDRDGSGATSHQWRIGNSEAARIDSNGNFGVGTSSPNELLHIASSSPRIEFEETDLTQNWEIGPGGGNFLFVDNNTGNIGFTIEAGVPNNVARIDSNGNLLVGTTSNDPAQTNNDGIELANDNTFSVNNTGKSPATIGRGDTGNLVIWYYQGGTGIGVISTDGATTSYNTGSDRRRKENDRSISDAVQRVKNTGWTAFDFIETGIYGEGIIAQDEVCRWPTVVSQDDNGWYMADYAKMVPALGAALSEALDRIEALEAKLN
jgi:hypothetical protein